MNALFIKKIKLNMNVLIVLNERISDWEEKGEIIENYFNPKNYFDKITILNLVKNEKVKKKTLQKLCGKAKFRIYFCKNRILTSKIFQFFFPVYIIKKFIINEFIFLKSEKINIIQSIGDGFSAFVSAILSDELKVKFFLSIHTVINSFIFYNLLSFKEKIIFIFHYRFKKKSYYKASMIIAVYESIYDCISFENKKKVKIIYNQIPVKRSNIKTNYSSKKIFELITVGRLIKGKSPENIIRAIINIDDIRLTIVGNGPLKRKLLFLCKYYKLESKVIFKEKLKNKDLIRLLKNFDAFICNTQYLEFPKTIIEALLVGLPLIVNDDSKTIKEYNDLNIFWTENTPELYKKTIEKVMVNIKMREIFSKNNVNISWKKFSESSRNNTLVKNLNNLL